MADVVYLHVGAPKTGTTYLQNRLYANRAALAEQGVHYPVGLRPDMFGAVLDLTGRDWPGFSERTLRGQWAGLVRRVQRAPGTAVISHELLADVPPEVVERVRADLDGVELHVVLTARDLARQLPADWQESLKYRDRRSLDTYLRQVRKAHRRGATTRFWRSQDVPQVLERWGAGLPPAQLHLVTVPPSGSGPDELWQRFAHVCGFDPARTPGDTHRANPSLGVDEVALLRQLNRRLRKAGLDDEAYLRVVKPLVVDETLSRRTGMRKVQLPGGIHPWLDEVAESWIDWARGSGIDVVGDLDELRPRPPVTGEDPATLEDREQAPRNARVADAALDALVALVLETAARPDPDTRLPARAGRVLRRLTDR